MVIAAMPVELRAIICHMNSLVRACLTF